MLVCLTADYVILGSRIPPTGGAQRSVTSENLKWVISLSCLLLALDFYGDIESEELQTGPLLRFRIAENLSL
jgi:hypothetical protein